MDKKITLRRNVCLEVLYFNTDIFFNYTNFIDLQTFKPSFRPSGPGSAASLLNFSTALGELGQNARVNGWCALREGELYNTVNAR